MLCTTSVSALDLSTGCFLVAQHLKFSPLDKENILRHFGGVDANSLEKMINFLDNESDSISIKHSPYFNFENLPSNLKKNETNLVALSLNAQSLGSKFNSLESMLRVLSD